MVTGAPARNLSKKAPMLRRACCSTPGSAGVSACCAALELARAGSCRVLKRAWPNENVRTRKTNSVRSKARLTRARLIIRQLPNLGESALLISKLRRLKSYRKDGATEIQKIEDRGSRIEVE